MCFTSIATFTSSAESCASPTATSTSTRSMSTVPTRSWIRFRRWNGPPCWAMSVTGSCTAGYLTIRTRTTLGGTLPGGCQRTNPPSIHRSSWSFSERSPWM
uniref:(northern house mosquito) hypothetical protein n=1 Tax=Culex pipiens TaxID=7175 RepID=A0A8D8C7C4_CULPI